MKKSTFFTAALVFTTSLIFSQNVPNGGFEDWEIAGNGTNEPVNWQTNNLDDLTFVYQEGGHTGSYSARISVEWDETLGMNITPMLYSHGFYPISERFTALNLYLMGESVDNNHLMVNIGMYKNGMNIGATLFPIYDDYADWTAVSVPISYATEDIPDECSISFTFWPAGEVISGSHFFIDDVELGSGSGPVTPILVDAITNTSGTVFELHFNTPMADPSGAQNQFSGTHNGSSVTFTGASLKDGDNGTIILSLANPVLAGEVLKVSYSAGTVTSAAGVALDSFNDQDVTNLVGGTSGSWQVIASGVEENLYSVHFANTNTGYIGGGMGRFMKSVNSGWNWSIIPSFSYAELFTVCATAPDDVHVGGWDTIYRSQNGGQSWNGVYINTVNYYVLDMQFHSASLGYAFLQASAFKKTTDGGNSWSAMTGSGVIDDFLAGYMIDEMNGFAVGGAGLITHTTDGGQTWPQYDWNGWTEWSPIDIEGVHFTSLSNGFAVADSGILLRTTNGGEHWTKSYIAGPEDRLKDIFFLNASLGWIVGYHGKIFSTNDGGNTWNAEPVITSQDLNSVFFISSNLGWAVGNNGTILRFGESSSRVNDTGLLPDENINIFPNPFSSKTTLNLTLKESMEISVEIFDLSGRISAVEFNGKLPAGSNSLQLDVPELHSGLYYCRIIYAGGNSCKPFMVIR